MTTHSSIPPAEKDVYEILVIEDDDSDWKLIERALNKATSCTFKHARVSHLSNGLTALRHRRYDAILLDLVLQWDGPANGIDTVVEVVREAPNTPIVVLSAMADIEVAVRAVDIGASAFVEKPPTAWRLESVVRQAIERYIKEEVVRRLMRSSLSKYSAEDAPVLAPLIGSHLDNIEAGLKHVRNYLTHISPAAVAEFDKILGYAHVATSTREIRKILRLENQDDRETTPPAAPPAPSPRASPTGLGTVDSLPREVLDMSLATATTKAAKRRRTISERAIKVVQDSAIGAGADKINTEADARAYLLAIQTKPPPGDTDD